MSRLAYPGISWDKIARRMTPEKSVLQFYTELSSRWDITSEALMTNVSFISAPGCLATAAAAGLVTPLRPCPDGHVAPFRCLRHGQAPNARPPAPQPPQPQVHLVHVAPIRPSAAATSAVPNSNALPLRCRNLCGMVGVALPFRNKGKTAAGRTALG